MTNTRYSTLTLVKPLPWKAITLPPLIHTVFPCTTLVGCLSYSMAAQYKTESYKEFIRYSLLKFLFGQNSRDLFYLRAESFCCLIAHSFCPVLALFSPYSGKRSNPSLSSIRMECFYAHYQKVYVFISHLYISIKM